MPRLCLTGWGSAGLRLVGALGLATALIPLSEGYLASPRPAWAAGFTVNSTADPGDGVCDASCTLRDAILAANGTGGADTITFSAGGTIVLGSALPAITDQLTIDGSAVGVAVDGATAYRVFTATVPLTLTALTVQNGQAVDEGGGAYFGSTATVVTVTFRSNSAGGAGGGGAYFRGAATVSGTLFMSNTAALGSGGGAYFSDAATLSSTTFSGNRATAGNGGGAAFASTATVSGAGFISNTALYDGGGAAFANTATVAGATFTRNRASFRAGGAFFGGAALVSATTFMSNTADYDGGGAAFYATAAVTGTTFSQNLAGLFGGGAFFYATAAVTGSTFISNTSGRGGGALFGNAALVSGAAFSGNTAPIGGGAVFEGLTAVTGSTFISNTANSGGGLYLGAGAQVKVDNTVIAANTALAPTNPAEIGMDDLGTTLTGRHNTLAAAVPGGGLAVSAGAGSIGATISLTNTIFHGYAVGVEVGAFGAAVTLEGVLWSDVTTPTQGAGLTVTNAFTGAAVFANAAGYDYHLTLTSTARDVGVPTSLSVDYDGDARPFGPAPDLGADESLVVEHRLFLPLILR